ncbi:MAG: FKBP-type peptidyl-prolyl cis-trans isomerase [Candidatus Azotimanducaceae bacterium]|jgi:FKBP-type peptidyl-prolyl cis-trans isomerase
MKKVILINALVLILAPLSTLLLVENAQAEDAPVAAAEQAPIAEGELLKNLGYFYGFSFGNMLKDGGGGDADIESLIQGLNDSLAGGMPGLSPSQQEAVLTEIRSRQEVINAERQQKASIQQQTEQAMSGTNLTQAEEYLANNGAREGIKTTASGLQYEIINEADGATASATSRVTVNYRGSLTNGEVFDESSDSPATFGLNQVISGWTEALQLMSVGDKYRLYLHPKLAYGAGSVGSIPPNSLLIFDVELLAIE